MCYDMRLRLEYQIVRSVLIKHVCIGTEAQGLYSHTRVAQGAKECVTSARMHSNSKTSYSGMQGHSSDVSHPLPPYKKINIF